MAGEDVVDSIKQRARCLSSGSALYELKADEVRVLRCDRKHRFRKLASGIAQSEIMKSRHRTTDEVVAGGGQSRAKADEILKRAWRQSDFALDSAAQPVGKVVHRPASRLQQEVVRRTGPVGQALQTDEHC